jgi:hypothetical protein
MATRPDQVRRILAELRAALGPEVPAWELLQLAALIVQAHRQPEKLGWRGPAARPPFFALDVDHAFARSGGWKVVDFERRQGMSFNDELPDSYYRAQSKLRGLLGH